MLKSSAIKPFEIIVSSGIADHEIQCVKKSIKKVLQIANISKLIKIEHQPANTEIMDRYLKMYQIRINENNVNHVDIVDLLENAESDGIIGPDRYFVILLDHNIFIKDLNNKSGVLELETGEYTSGLTWSSNKGLSGLIISTLSFMDREDSDELLKTAVFHELGHLFNAAEGNIGKNVNGDKKYFNHCFNDDVMRQQEKIPEDTILATEERLRTGVIYCDYCTKVIKNFFRM